MYEWTQKRIDWYKKAIEYTRFDEQLADALAPQLPKDESVCDLGCGTGYLALSLARRGYSVTAADKSRTALDVLRADAATEPGLELRIIEADWGDFSECGLWDNVIMVCAGGFDEELSHYRRLCRKRLIVVTRWDNLSRVRCDGGASQRFVLVPDLVQLANGRGESYNVSLEFGQPFATLDEAREYIIYFGGEQDLENTLKNLEKTGNEKFPFYMKHPKKLIIYVLEPLNLEDKNENN